MTLSTTDADFVRELVRARSAIVVDASKSYLIESRLGPVARQHGLAGPSELVANMRRRSSTELENLVVDAMTTNETSFYRDPNMWQGLEQHVLPQLIEARRTTRQLNIWSAACSSGQEPYSLAMLLVDRFPEVADWNVRILASDLSAEMLGRAASGRFTQLEVNRGLPAPMLVRHFRRDGPAWQIDEKIRRMIEFRAINLAEPWPFVPAMDLLLCRNVLIYFDLDRKREILGRCRHVLRPGGSLVLGGSETTMNIDDGYERVVAGTITTYRPR